MIDHSGIEKLDEVQGCDCVSEERRGSTAKRLGNVNTLYNVKPDNLGIKQIILEVTQKKGY